MLALPKVDIGRYIQAVSSTHEVITTITTILTLNTFISSVIQISNLSKIYRPGEIGTGTISARIVDN